LTIENDELHGDDVTVVERRVVVRRSSFPCVT
jgi:hypothetical protein